MGILGLSALRVSTWCYVVGFIAQRPRFVLKKISFSTRFCREWRPVSSEQLSSQLCLTLWPNLNDYVILLLVIIFGSHKFEAFSNVDIVCPSVRNRYLIEWSSGNKWNTLLVFLFFSSSFFWIWDPLLNFSLSIMYHMPIILVDG